MNEQCEEAYSTPVQRKGSCKRLGLRRRNDSSISKEMPLLVAKSKETECVKKAIKDGPVTPFRQVQSDAKINYRKLDKSSESKTSECFLSSPGTPNSLSLIRKESISTHCRPFRLSLSKRVREKMTKKRLEFHLANDINKDEEQLQEDKFQNDIVSIATLSSETKETCKTSRSEEEPQKMTDDELIAAIEHARKELKAHQVHVEKVQDLKNAIDTWKTGFSSALEDLQEKIVPAIDKEDLLHKLNISKDMLKYVND